MLQAVGGGLKRIVKAACGQFSPRFGDTDGNLEHVCSMTEESGADLIVFPELATSGYDFRDRTELESLALDLYNGTEIIRLKRLAKDTGTHIVIGLPERTGDRLFNSAALIEPGGRTSIYRKLQLFDREKHLFEPGDAPPRAVDTAVGRIGMMVCFDWIFPEVARLLALDGAQIICHPANLVLQFCQRAMFARSVENGVFTITCNRIGTESRLDRELIFNGNSQILSNRGDMLVQAGYDMEEIITAEIEPALADDKMITGNNHLLEDRRHILGAQRR